MRQIQYICIFSADFTLEPVRLCFIVGKHAGTQDSGVNELSSPGQTRSALAALQIL